MTIGCNIWTICSKLNWLFYDPSWMSQLSELVWILRSSVCVVFNNFLLINTFLYLNFLIPLNIINKTIIRNIHNKGQGSIMTLKYKLIITGTVPIAHFYILLKFFFSTETLSVLEEKKLVDLVKLLPRIEMFCLKTSS